MFFGLFILAPANAHDGAIVELTGVAPKIRFGPVDVPVCELILNNAGRHLESTCDLHTPSMGNGIAAVINNLTAIVTGQQQVIASLQEQLEAIKSFVGMLPPPLPPPPSPPASLLCHKKLTYHRVPGDRTDEFAYYACGPGTDATTEPLFTSYYRGSGHEQGGFVAFYGGAAHNGYVATCTGVAGWTWDGSMAQAEQCLQLAQCQEVRVANLPVQNSGCA